MKLTYVCLATVVVNMCNISTVVDGALHGLTRPGDYYKYHSSRASVAKRSANINKQGHSLLRGDAHQTLYNIDLVQAGKGNTMLGNAVYSNARHLSDIITECDSTVLVQAQTEEHYGISNIECALADGTLYSVPGLNPEVIRSRRNAVANGEIELVLPPGSTVNRTTANIDIPRGTSVSFKDTNNRSYNSTRRRLQVGVRRVLVVRVVAADGQSTSTEQQLSNAVFGTSGDLVNLKSQYRACSYNQLLFEPVSEIGVVDGTTTVTVSTTIGQGSAQLHAIMSNAITTALNAKFGVSNPGLLADHILYCLPPGAFKVVDKDGNLVDGKAYATETTAVGSWLSVYNDEW